MRGNLQADAAGVRVHVDKVRIVQRVDRVANSHASTSVTMISTLVNGCGVRPTASARDGDQQHGHDDAGDDQQADAVGVVCPRMLADRPRLARCQSKLMHESEEHEGRDVETSHRPQRPAAAAALAATGTPTISTRQEHEEARGRDLVADGVAASP